MTICRTFACLAVWGGGVAIAAAALAQDSTPAAQAGLAITVYQQDLAFVRDRRTASLAGGDARMLFTGVSEALVVDTLALTATDGQPLTVHAMTHDAELLTPESLLRASVGGTVRLIRDDPETGEERVEEAEVLAVVGGVVLRVGDRIEIGIPGRLVFDAVPARLRAEPVVLADVTVPAPGSRAVELAYLTHGLGWRADYLAVIDDAGDSVQLRGWANVRNDTAVAFRDVDLALLAGQVQFDSPRPVRADVAQLRTFEAVRAAPSPVAVDAYQLFELGRPVTLAPGETQRLALVEPRTMPAVRTHRLDGAPLLSDRGLSQPVAVVVRLTLSNPQGPETAAPLPAGAVRVFGAGPNGRTEFLGAAAMAALPVGEQAVLDYGRAFDVTARRFVDDFRQEGQRGEIIETAQRLVLRNAGVAAVTVDVVETMAGNWRILQESQPHFAESAFQPKWQVAVPAGGTAELSYRVRIERR